MIRVKIQDFDCWRGAGAGCSTLQIPENYLSCSRFAIFLPTDFFEDPDKERNKTDTGIGMGRITQIIFVLCLSFVSTPLLRASEGTPWGASKVLDIEYEPQKVVYDLSSGDMKNLVSVLDRVGFLYKLYGSDTFDSSIVVVIHGGAIPFFAIDEFEKNKEIMQRAQSLTVGTSIEFRMCQAAAKLLNYKPNDIHGFVTMVPMADAEIVRLQHDGYAYMQ